MAVLRTMWGNAMVARIRARRVFVLGAVLANLVALPRALALDPDRRISQYGHTAWRIQDGAISPPTNIAQTSDGFLWITTAQGLMRFDGVRFVPWQPPQGQNLPGTHFSALLGSRDGSLWIGTTRGLARWKDGQLRTYTDLEHPTGISAIIEDDFGTIWATRYGQYAREAPLCNISKETLHCFGKKEGIPVTYGLGLAHDSEGNIWFGSTVLVRWRPGTPPTTYFYEIAELAKGDGVGEIALGPPGTAWASLDGTGPQLGVRHYSGGKWTSYAVPGFDGARALSHALLVDRRGSLWVGTQNDGVYRICGGVADHYGVSDGLSGNSVVGLFKDREGNLWVATDGGLDMFRDTALISYTTRQGVSERGLHSVMALRNGAVWMGTGDALNILRKQDGKTAILDRKLSGQGVGPMLEDHSGAVWLGVDLALMRFQNGRFREIGGQRFAGIGGVEGIAEDSGGTTWVLSKKNQLFSIVGDKIEKQASLDDELGRQSLLVADRNGGVWLGTQQGKSTISHFRDGRLQTTSLSSPQGPAGIQALFVDSDNSLLVTSSQGLYRFNHGQVTLFSSDNGLPCPETFNAIRDNHGALWIYTRCGLVRIAGPEWAKWIESPHVAVSVMTLDALDGAQAGTGSFSQPMSSKAPDGRLWFVTGVSAQVLDPNRLYENAPPPPVYVEGVVADRKRFDATSFVKVPALSRDLEIDYTAPSFSVPQKVRFRYMLEGRDREWQDAGTRRQAFYTDLKPRHYRFRVTACNSSGVWNQTGASLDFVVLPAYYQTIWFRLSCVAALIALFWALYRMRVHQLQEQEKKFRDAVETMPALAFVADPKGNRTFLNRGWLEYTGLSSAQASGSGWQMAIHPDDLKRVAEQWSESQTTGGPLDYEARLRRGSDGTYRWFQTRARPLRDHRGRIVKWCAVATDIQDRKRAEELQADLAHTNRISMLGELAASISHELKQPVSAAVMDAQASLRWLNRDQPDLDQARRATAAIVKDGKLAVDIIDRLRSLYKKTPPQREPVDVDEIIAEMVLLMRSEATEYAVSIRAEPATDLPRLTADRVQLQQVLMNLMLNGIEAMKDTGGVLTVKTARGDCGQVLISVSDTGAGLPAGRADEIFDAFFTTKPQGSGMGLAISKSIVESHGGRIWASDDGGRGATFHFALPAARVATNPSADVV
jgi:PAS domain S-box-containing protein